MTRKDSELIARIISETYSASLPEHADIRWRMGLAFSRELAKLNPRFDQDRFMAACRTDRP